MAEASPLPEHPPCPHCGSEQTERMSDFGSVLANAQFYCNGCRTTFEIMKWRKGGPPDS